MPPQLWVPSGDAHCEFGLRWAYKYKGELEQWFRDKAPADAFLVALQKGAVDADGVRQPAGQGYHFTAVTLPGLVALLETVRSQPANLNLYEYLVDERPRRIGVDLEYELAEPKHREPASELWPDDFEAVFADKELFLRRTLVDVFLPALSALVGRTLTTADCYLMDSSTSTGSKKSYHVVTDVVLPDKASREAFHRWIQVTFRTGRASKRLSPLLDCSVYSSVKPMRLGGCNKTGKQARLVPVASVGSLVFKPVPSFSLAEPFTEELLATHMWTAVVGRGGCTELRLAPEAPGAGDRSRPKSRRDGGQSQIKTKRKRSDDADPGDSQPPVSLRDNMSREAFAALFGISFEDYKAGVLTNWFDGGVAEADLPPDDNRVGPEIYWKTKLPHQCSGGHFHEKNSFITRLEVGGAVYRACFSTKCAGNDPRDTDKHWPGPGVWRLLGFLPVGGSSAPATPSELGQPPPSPHVGEGTHLPLVASFYAEGIEKLGAKGGQPEVWRLVPASYTFETRDYRFLALFEVYEGHLAVHSDGYKRLVGVTDRCQVVVGKKRGDARYEWELITHCFFAKLREWWEHHPVRSTLPPPETPEGFLPQYTLPCCAASSCRLTTCRTHTGAPWRHLHEIAAHRGLKKPKPAAAPLERQRQAPMTPREAVEKLMRSTRYCRGPTRGSERDGGGFGFRGVPGRVPRR